MNVDSHATGKITPELLTAAPPDLFAQVLYNFMDQQWIAFIIQLNKSKLIEDNKS